MVSPKGDVLSMSKTTQIELEPNDCIFLVKQSRIYTVYNSTVFNGVVSKKVR